jgi:nicotinamidase-related amidase
MKATALVIIDLQKGIAQKTTHPHSSATVISNAARLADAFRQRRMPVFLVHVMPSPDLGDALRPTADSPMQSGAMPPDWADFVPELGPQEGDFIITKRQWGAFYGTELDLQLRRRGITTIVLCGISTNIGVESTARDAYERGYEQLFAADAMASGSSQEEHASSVKHIFPKIGRVRSTEQIIEMLGS